MPKGRRNRKQSWSDTRVVRVEPPTQTDRPNPPRYWNGRRLHVVEFTDELLAPVPGRGERWAVSGPGDRLGAFLVEDVLEPTAVEQLLKTTEEYIISSGPVSALCAQARHLPAWKPTGNPAMPRACHTRNRLTVVLFKDAAVGDKVGKGPRSPRPGRPAHPRSQIDLRQCEARGAFHVCDALTGKIVADSPVCLGEGDNPILAELSPCRNDMGWGIVKRTAALEPGLRVGSCVCFEPAPTQAQLVARKRRLIAEAHAAAEKDVGRKPAPAAAVEHHLVRMGCGSIGATAAELRRCPATAAGVEPTALDIRWLAVSELPRTRKVIASLTRAQRPTTATGATARCQAQQTGSRQLLPFSRAVACWCAEAPQRRGGADSHARPPQSSRQPASATASAPSWSTVRRPRHSPATAPHLSPTLPRHLVPIRNRGKDDARRRAQGTPRAAASIAPSPPWLTRQRPPGEEGNPVVRDRKPRPAG